MKTKTFTRRRKLASTPAVAAAAAATGDAPAVPDHLDPRRVRGLAEALPWLDGMPKEEANTVLEAITSALKWGLQNHAQDASR